MPYTFTTMLKPDVQRILNHFRACFDIRILCYDPQGHEISVGKDMPDSHYCRLLQERLYGEERCLTLDLQQRETAAGGRQLICYQCHGGLIEALKPFYFQNRLLGYVMIGQFRSIQEPPQQVLDDWRQMAGDSEELLSAFTSLPYVPQQKVDDILGLFSIIVEYLVMQHMVSLSGDQVFGEVLAYMEANLTKQISLDNVSRVVGKRPSTISHLFTRHLGRSFKQTLQEMKIGFAEEYMRANAPCTVQQAAAAAGFLDPLYFSRIYKRYRGVAPSKFLSHYMPDKCEESQAS